MKGKKALLAGAIFVSSILAYNCGGGGGGTTSTGGTTPLNVFVTDAFPPDLTALEVTLYQIDLCYDNRCEQTETVFSSQAGVPVDLTALEGKLFYINTNNVPAGIYEAIQVITSDTGIVAYKGVTGTASFNLQECQNNKCIFRIIINPPIDTTTSKDVVIDFNLASSNTDIQCNTTKDANGQDTATCSVNSLDVSVKTDIQQNNNQQPAPDNQMIYVYETYGLLQHVDTNTNQIEFSWAGKTYIGNIETNVQQQPVTICEINDNYYFGSDCISELQSELQKGQTGICLELKLEGNPAQPEQPQKVIKLETTHPKKCGKSNTQADDDYYEEYKYEMYVAIGNILNGNITIGNTQCSISENVYCEIDDINEEDKHLIGQNCLDALQQLSQNIGSQQYQAEVKYRLYTDDATGQQKCEIYKIDVDDLDDYYEYGDNYNSNGNYGNMNDNYMEYNENHNDNYEGNMNENDNYENMNGNDNYYENNENHNANVNQPL